MAAPKGNQFWKARSSHGRDPIFKSPDQLWEACCEYFEWVDENPLETAIVYQGELKEKALPKMRPMTISGMCLYLDISVDAWELYRGREDFIGVTKKAEQIIYNQKFAGATADLMNPNIIARDLGLADKQDRKVSGNLGLTDLSSEELDRRLQQLEDMVEQSERD